MDEVSALDSYESSTAKRYILVPHTIKTADVPNSALLKHPVQTVTDLWVEQCMQTKTLVDPSVYIPGQLPRRIPVEGKAGILGVCKSSCLFEIGFDSQVINATGFGIWETRHLQLLVNLLGLKSDPCQSVH